MTQRAAVITPAGAAFVGIGSLLSGVSGYITLVLAARLLSSADNAIFLAFWSFLFFWFGVLSGLSLETTRAVSNTQYDRTEFIGVRVLPNALLIGTLLALVILATSYAWGPSVLGPDYELLGAIVAGAVLLWSGHSAIVGSLSGRRDWMGQALVTGGDGLVRVGSVLVSATAMVSVVGFSLAAGLGASAWLILALLSRRVRNAWTAHIVENRYRFLVNSSTAMLAAAASSAIVVGFPVLIRLTSTDADYLSSAPLILSIALTRAPLLVPLNAYQSVAITYFVSDRDRAARVFLQLTAGILAIGCIGAALAWTVGPFMLATFINRDYEIQGWVLAALTIAAGLLALLTLTGALALALHLHVCFAAGWLSATFACILVLLLPAEVDVRTTMSLIIGPTVGVGLHVAGLVLSQRYSDSLTRYKSSSGN